MALERNYLVALLGLWLVACTGCASISGGGQFWTKLFPNRKDDALVDTPSKRIENLRKLAKSADSADAAELQRVSQLLADSMQKELDAQVRMHTVLALAKYPSDASRAAVARAMADADRDVRLAACEALGELNGPDAAKLLSEALVNEERLDIRIAALRALGKLPNEPPVINALALGLEDSDPAIQYRAIQSLTAVSGKEYGVNVNLWRQYCQGQNPTQPPVSMAQRLKNLF